MKPVQPKRYCVDKSEVSDLLERINRRQAKENLFVNVRVVPYRGKKYDRDKTVTVIEG